MQSEKYDIYFPWRLWKQCQEFQPEFNETILQNSNKTEKHLFVCYKSSKQIKIHCS